LYYWTLSAVIQKPRHYYEFNHFRLDPGERQLTRDDKEVQLTPKALETVLVLVESSGHVVEKEQINKKVWADSHVEEAF
jgi:DNA-binding winged helix-turn-helix (wHTH) protein